MIRISEMFRLIGLEIIMITEYFYVRGKKTNGA
jgi:hypothetical protein